MTTSEFLDLVPWEQMHVTRRGLIRATGPRCPITAVWGGLLCDAEETAIANGLSESQAASIIDAADCRGELDLLNEMHARLRRRSDQMEMKLIAGQIVHVQGIPVELCSDVAISTNPGNWDLIQGRVPDVKPAKHVSSPSDMTTTDGCWPGRE